jgi:hypothetical protein
LTANRSIHQHLSSHQLTPQTVVVAAVVVELVAEDRAGSHPFHLWFHMVQAHLGLALPPGIDYRCPCQAQGQQQKQQVRQKAEPPMSCKDCSQQ